jgi:predicted MPP superfamily phosphohydrolase
MRWATAVNALACDLVVVTGDMVTNGSHFHVEIADVVGAMRAKDGVVVAMGNHDYFGDGEGLVAKLRERGARVLRNASEALTRGGTHVRLAAIDDRWSRRSNMDEALRGREPGEPAILLAHDPVDFAAAASRGVDLVLSGHTHGGQLAVPLLARHANLSRFSREHTLGVYRRGRSQLVVHPGLGTSGPPVRVGVAPAIVEITLRVA